MSKLDVKRHWKEPVNGISVFFSEESFTRVLGSLSVQERLAQNFEQDPQISQICLPKQSQTIQKVPQNQGTSKDATAVVSQPQGENLPNSGNQGKSITQLSQPAKKPTARKSSLSCKEQRRYLELFQKYLLSYKPQRPTPAEIKELTEFEALQVRVSAEQAEFLKYTEKVAHSRHFDYQHLIPSARKYVDEKINHQWRRVDQYARYYLPDNQIPLCVPVDKDYCPTLMHQKLLLELGCFPKVFIPDMSRLQTVPTLLEKINKRFPANGRKTQNKTAWNHEVCSKDSNAETLAQKYDCQVVASSAVLKCLVDNHGPKFERNWEIPVVVRLYEHDYGDISSKQKIVFIDKPFAPKTLNNREKNTMFHKYALKTFISHQAFHKGQKPSNVPVSDDGTSAKSVGRPDSANLFGDETSMEDLETFGSFDFKTSKRSLEPAKNVENSSTSKTPVEQKKTVALACDQDIKSEHETDTEGSLCKATSAKFTEQRSAKNQQDRGTKSKVSGVHMFGSSEGDSSQEDSLVIDIPECPPSRTTRSQSRNCAAASPHEEDMSHLTEGDGEHEGRRTEADTQVKQSGKHLGKAQGKPAETKSNLQVVGSSISDPSQEQSLVMDLPASPQARTTRSRSKKSQDPSKSDSLKEKSKLASDRKEVKQEEESSDDGRELVIDLGETSLRTRSRSGDSVSQATDFIQPKRMLRKRKGIESGKSVESDSSPEGTTRVTRSRSACQRSRSNSASDLGQGQSQQGKRKITKVRRLESEPAGVHCPDECDKEIKKETRGNMISPSKVDNIMIKTSTDDLSTLPPMKDSLSGTSENAQKEKKSGLKTGASTLDSILQMQQQMLPTKRMESVEHRGEESPVNYSHPEEHNISYHLWSFSGLNLLIRCSCHGILRDLLHNKPYPVNIVPKLEYQVKFGVEQVTMSEVSRDWVSAYIKPNTKLVRGRINAKTSELIKVDEVDLNAVVNPALSFAPGQALGSLHNLFLRLTELPVGQYLLKHTKGDNFCQLYRNTDTKRGAYDLKFSYMGFGPSVPAEGPPTVPWVPIDPTVILSSHKKQGRIPCTFEPENYNQKGGQKPQAQKKKGQNKKKWQGKKKKGQSST